MKNLNSSLLTKNNIDILLVTNPTNITYLTGFIGLSPTEREALVFVNKDKITLLTARLYEKEAKKIETPEINILIAAERNQYESYIRKLFSKSKNIGFEPNNLTYTEYKRFKKFAGKSKFIPLSKNVEQYRETKSQQEIQKITKAQLISQKSFSQIIKTLSPGQTEAEIAEKLISILKHNGGDGLAFEPIIASGPNSSLPHYKTGKRRLQKKDVLLLDFGAKYKNYCADLSRTVFIGKTDDQKKNIWHLVYNTQQAAIQKVKKGAALSKVHAFAQYQFKKQGVSEKFIHGLGHGIGLEVHEKPSVSQKSKDTANNGMVFSIEPGLYFNWGGIRIEDLVYIKDDRVKMIGENSLFIENI